MDLAFPGFRITVERAPPRRRPSHDPETPLARALRWQADHARLAAMEPRLLADFGLTPEDVARDVPFRNASARRAAR